MRKDLPELKYDDPTPVFCKAHRAKGIKLFKENLNEKKLCKRTKKDRVSSRAKDLNLTEQPIPTITPTLAKKKPSKLETVEVELFTPTDQSPKVSKKSKEIQKTDKKITEFTVKRKTEKAKIIE